MSTISASTTSTTAYKVSADTTGTLVLQTGATPTTAVTISSAQVVTLASALPESSGGTGTTTGYYGFKNRIINGGMVIDQRNAGASVTPTNGQFSVDRWMCLVSAASKYTAQQNAAAVTPPVGFIKYLGITSSSAYSVAAGDYFNIRQGIEGLNVADLAWGTASAATITLSFWVRSSLTGTFGGGIVNGAGDRSYPYTYTISVANTWEQKTITIAGDTTGTWVTTNSNWGYIQFGLGVGTTYSGTAGAWAAGNYLSATGATSVVGTSGATFYITGVQLEKGSTATSFDYRPYSNELALCQRYLPAFRYDTSNTMLPTQLQFNSTTTGRGMIAFPVPTRTTVTGSTISSAAHFTCFDSAGTNTVVSAMAAAVGGTNGALIDANVAAGGILARNYTLGITNSAGYIYFTGAEL